jgi:hypothetical protein
MSLDPSSSLEVIPQETAVELCELLNKKYQVWRGERSFHISSRRDHECIEVKVVLSNVSETFYYPVEGRVDHEAEEMDPVEAALFLVNYIDGYFEEFFEEDENLFIPIDWAEYSYDAVEFQLRGQVLNRFVERISDELLKAHPAVASVLN